jgi:soluble cytochrome b562
MNLFKFLKSHFLDQFTLHLGGGGGGGQTTSTVQNTNVPEYARPYVETMLGATQEQLFQGNRTPVTTDPVTGETTGGQFNITGFKPYQAYGGTYDAQGNQLSYDPSKAIAGFSPMQTAAQQGIAGMVSPTAQYGKAQFAAEHAGLGAMQSAQQAYNYGQLGYESGARGQQLGLAAAADAQALAKEQAGRANKFGDAGFASGQKGQELGIAGGKLGIEGGAKYGEMGAGFGKQAAGLADPALAYGAQGAGYGQTGAGYGAQAAQLANTALGYGQGSADIGQMALRAQGMGENISSQSQALARQQAMAGQQYAQMATDPRVTQALMNPYTQNVLDVQNKELQRQADIAAQGRGAAAVRAGAFGGGRQAIENAEAQRNLETMKTANTAQALNQAYQQAQAQQQFGANLNLQGLAGAQQGLGTALQGGQLGLSGLGTALQGQQGALAGVGQAGAMYGLGMQGAQTGIQGTQAGLAGVNAANQAYQTGIQGAGMGLQGVNTQLAGVDRQLAGTAQGMQGAQVGLAGVNAATNAGQLGLQGAQVGLQGTAQGMQGAQTGLQGVQGAQAGYGLLGQQGANLTNILGQQQQNQLGLYGAQSAAGAQQQALEQQKINQAMQDYANAQQYPLMQLGTMSNMLRGLPMQASTTNQYQAAPNQVSQAIGTIGAGASIYNAMKPPGQAAGGEVKGYAKGGIMSYDMGGEVEEQLESMDEKGLAAQAKESSSPSIRRMAQRLLRERQMGNKPQGTGPMGVQYQAAQLQMPSYAPGGIVAFATGGGANEEGGEDEAKIGMQERLAQPAPTTGGIMGATTQPITPVPAAPQVNRALQQSPDIPAFMKAEYAEAEKRKNAPLSEFMAERQAAMREAGVADTSEGQQRQRAELMAEKANMADEKERQRHLRLAEFFASWGSTPGPTLVAGMNALKQAVPGIISDDKEQKKARREIDKSIADLDNATRLEKRGEVDAAMALKLKAAEDMKALNTKFIDYQSRRESDASSAAASKYSADMQFRSEQLRSEAARLDRAARRETEDDQKRFNAYSAASAHEQRLISKISDQMKLLAPDYETVKTAEMNAKQNDGKMTPAFVPAYEAAKKKIADQEAIWTKQKEQAARDSELAYSRIRINPQATKDYTKPSAAPAPTPAAASSGPISGEFSAPTAAHITALKKNPEQAEAFDAKFGPGAAKEYLGK